MTKASDTTIKLLAKSQDDVTVLSSLVQDAIIDSKDIAWVQEDHQFLVVMNRFCWERLEGGSSDPCRIHSALRVDGVKHVHKRGFGHFKETDYLELLSMGFYQEDGSQDLVLHFAGDRCIKVEVEDLSAALSDLGEAWPTKNIPSHDVSE